MPPVRLRQLRDLPGPGLLHPGPVAARPGVRLRDRARQGRRRAGPGLVHRRQAAAQEEHLHRLHRVRGAPGEVGLDLGVPAGGPGRLGGRPADGRGGQPGAAGLRRHRGPGAVRRRAEHDPGPVAAADRDRMGGVGRPAARPAGLRVHEVLHAVRERDRAGLPADLRPGRPERHPGDLPRARQVDRAAARGGQGRPVPAQDRDGGGPRRPQRPLRRLAGGGPGTGLDHPDRRAPNPSGRTGS